MTTYLSNRDGNGKTSEEGHYKFPTSLFSGNVLGSTSLLVKQNSPLGRNVLVSAGQYKIDTSTGYSYTGWISSDELVAISTADAANPRITTIVAYVDKNATTSASPPNNPGITKLMAVNGTPSAVPTAPNSTVIQAAVGSGNPYIILANVTVAASASQIVNANIADARIQIIAGPGLVGSASLQDGSVTTSKLPDSAVSTAKLANTSVTTAKIGDAQVTAAKIETQQAWQNVAFQNNWINYGETWSTGQYMKDSLGFVTLRGLLKNGNAGATMFTLPVGYRPLGGLIYIADCQGGYSRIDVNPTGTVVQQGYKGGGNNQYLSLAGIRFKAEQ